MTYRKRKKITKSRILKHVVWYFRSILAGKGIARAGSGNKTGKGIVRAGYGKEWDI